MIYRPFSLLPDLESRLASPPCRVGRKVVDYSLVSSTIRGVRHDDNASRRLFIQQNSSNMYCYPPHDTHTDHPMRVGSIQLPEKEEASR
jgi:hypothetical protein